MISKEEAIERAREAAVERGWRWEEPISAKLVEAGLFSGRDQWEIRTNSMRRGSNARIVIDATDGSVVAAFWLPR